MERDTYYSIDDMIIVNFNSHAHVERDYQIITVIISKSNFNSHAHVERDKLEGLIGASGRISTHTLTWSVTESISDSSSAVSISTHTLTWSVTTIIQPVIDALEFQLTRSRGA